jgi:hypothetical protein
MHNTVRDVSTSLNMTNWMQRHVACDGRLSILYLEHAISAKEDGGHYAYNNCCSKNENGSVG